MLLVQSRRLPAARLLICAALFLTPAMGLSQAGEDAALGAHKLATHMYKAGNFAKAAELYHTAFKIDPKPAFLFNAARAEQRVMMLEVAEKHFKQVLALKGVDARTVSRSRMHLQEIETVRKALMAAQAKAGGKKAPPTDTRTAEPAPVSKSVDKSAAPAAAAPSPAAHKNAEAPATVVTKGGGWKAPAGWASVITGGVLAGVGGWLLVSYMNDQEALDARQVATTGGGKVKDISYAEYEEQQTALWTRRGLGFGVLGVGLAAVGAGAWMVLTAPESGAVTVAPTHRGVLLALRF